MIVQGSFASSDGRGGLFWVLDGRSGKVLIRLQ